MRTWRVPAVRAAVLPALLPALLLTGCAGSHGGDRVVVLAAASLAGALGEAERRYEADRPGVDLRLSHAGSQVLATQVREGAAADLLVTADEPTMQRVVDLVGAQVPVAANQLALIVPAANPARVVRLEDLARPDVRVVLAAPSVPAGALARSVLALSSVHVRPLSLEPDVQAVVSRVRLGEADAGLAYLTDLRAGQRRGDLTGSSVPGSATTYPAAVVRGAAGAQGAQDFLDWLLSPPGVDVLRAFDFQPPP